MTEMFVPERSIAYGRAAKVAICGLYARATRGHEWAKAGLRPAGDR
jgi:hypothetical protein